MRLVCLPAALILALSQAIGLGAADAYSPTPDPAGGQSARAPDTVVVLETANP